MKKRGNSILGGSVLGREGQGVAGKRVAEEIMYVTPGSTQPSQQKPGIEMGLYGEIQ